MAWVAVDSFGNEAIFKGKPRRYCNYWTEKRFTMDDSKSWYDSAISLPKGTIKNIIGRELSWNDEPVELTEE